MVKDIAPGADSSDPEDLTDVEGTLYFTAERRRRTGMSSGRSDGTEAGTVMVKDIAPGGSGPASLELTDVGGTLYFAAYDGTPRVRSSGGATGPRPGPSW